MGLVETAKEIAYEAHKGQQRKYTGMPYITHPHRVANAIQSACPDYMTAAAFLHDVFEDCHAKWRSEVANECGSKVFNLVHELTNPSKGLGCNRAIRKEIDRTHIAHISHEACVIKLVDRIDNLGDMLGGDDDFKRLYWEESGALISVIQLRTPSRCVFMSKLIGVYQEKLDKLKESIQ